MRIPNADAAIIPGEKLRDYLLSRSHPIGRHKATFFAGLGYTEAEWSMLESDLRIQHLDLNVEEVDATRYGRKFMITGILNGPSASALLVSVWIIRADEDVPRFVTAYPGVER
ncbi:MAG: DUF6883 domain-containing protein [Dehalococcoidia bacterium]